MRAPAVLAAALLLASSGTVFPSHVHAQGVPAPFPTWHAEVPLGGAARRSTLHRETVPVEIRKSVSRTHTETGLLIGGLVGVGVTTAFLVLFCSDPDTSCGAGEVATAAMVFTLPTAAVGALIGSLVQTEE